MILPESLAKLVTFTKQIGLELEKSSFTLDSGFDSKTNKDLIKEQKLVPVINPNRRNTKEPIAIARMYRWFTKKHYKERYKVERKDLGSRGYPLRLVGKTRIADLPLAMTG